MFVDFCHCFEEREKPTLFAESRKAKHRSEYSKKAVGPQEGSYCLRLLSVRVRWKEGLLSKGSSLGGSLMLLDR